MSLLDSELPSAQRTWTVLRPVDPEVLQRMLLYASKTAYYLLGYYGDETRCRLLTFPKQAQNNEHRLEVVEDPRTYTPSEAQDYLQRIHSDPNAEGLTLLCEAFGILGCFRFLEGYYLFLITKRKAVGSLAGHSVYGISDTALIPLTGCHDGWAERRYRKLLLSGVDLTKDFFFSYTYNISYTVQHNLTHEEHLDPFDCIFVWNAYLTRDLRTALSDTKWVLPLVHGSWQQRNLSIFGKIVQLTLISRRSRRFAGTRYLKRGINQLGWVANEVETEQIVSLQNLNQSGVPSLASIVQIRGSIPLFWGQATSALNPRPSIQLYNMDPLYEATRKHFDDLFERYGQSVVVLNLVKSQERQPRETILRKAFGRAVSFLNDHIYTNNDQEIVYHPWDFKAHMKKDARRFFKETEPLMQDCVQKTGFCSMHPNAGHLGDIEQLQNGVLRSNCIDCLDRTNISQYFFGLVALGSQLCSLGLLSSKEIDPDCSFAYQLMQMYEIMGNVLALQYGGSEAHGTFFERMRGNSEAATQSRELLRTIKRYYSNAVSDPEKQDAINLFLGHFIPKHNEANIWELDSDYFLHCGVDYEKRHSNFGLRPSCSLSTRPSTIDSGPSKLAHKASSSLEFFPVPVVSRAGGPEVLPTEQPMKKEATLGSWRLSSWFRPTREDTPFRLPNARGPVLDSLEEMLTINPVVEVRLYDDDIHRKQKEEQRPAFQKTIARLLTQEALTERETGPVRMVEGRSDSCAGYPSVSSESAVQIRSASQRPHRCPRPMTLSDRPVTKHKRTLDLGLSSNEDAFPRTAKSETRTPCLARRSWFGGLTRRSAESKDKRSTTAAHRTLSTPTEVTKVGIQGSNHPRFVGRSDPVEEFWDAYWSITEQSLTKELTLAERVAAATDKREAIRLARANNSFAPKHTVGTMTAANVFLDELLDHCLDAKSPIRCIPDQVQESESRGEQVRSDGDASPQTTLGVRSNINELLYCSARGPGDRVLEKWFLADQKAKADYHRNLMWIMTPVDSATFGPIQA